MTIAITGGTGFVGQAVLDAAQSRGKKIRVLTRREQAAREGVEWIGGDLADKQALARLVDGASTVLHIAGVVNAPDLTGFEQGNVVGTQNCLAAARVAGVPRFICVSSLSAREPGLSDYGGSKRRAEEAVQQSGLDWSIVRPPAIYGPRDTEMLDLFRAAKMGIVPMPPSGAASIVHVEDLARLLLDFANVRANLWEVLSGHIFEPDDGREGGWPHAELAHAIGVAVGRKVWAPAMPAWLVKSAARLDLSFRKSHAKLTPDRARYMVHPDWVSHLDKAVQAKIWRPEIATNDGLAATAQWYRTKGWL